MNQDKKELWPNEYASVSELTAWLRLEIAKVEEEQRKCADYFRELSFTGERREAEFERSHAMMEGRKQGFTDVMQHLIQPD